MIHKLKTWPVFYDDVESGVKTFEIRENDRNFQVGDTLILEKFEPETGEYTGESISVKVDYTICMNILPGFPKEFNFIGMAITLLD